MKLIDYIADRGLKQRDVARGIDRSEATVSRIVNRTVIPDWETMMRIHSFTGGKVTPNDFIDPGEAA